MRGESSAGEFFRWVRGPSLQDTLPKGPASRTSATGMWVRSLEHLGQFQKGGDLEINFDVRSRLFPVPVEPDAPDAGVAGAQHAASASAL